MPLFSRTARPRRSVAGYTAGTAVRGVRLLLRGGFRSGRWVTHGVGRVRARGAGGETGMTRMFDLHAASCAGDTLIAIGLAGTIFFNVPLGEARTRVGLYLLVTMVPFALLAPVVGPLLDHFRHGRRYAMAATMLGRAFLAWLISDYIHGIGLYPAAFGVLALSRAYGVARSAAVPRLLPAGLGLSQVGARASVYGTVAGAVVAPLGLAAFWFGPQWPLRVSSLIFLAGMVIALRLPAQADSEPPESTAGAGLRRRGTGRVLQGALVTTALLGSATLRAGYGFLLLFLAFAIRAGDLHPTAFGRDVGAKSALGLVGAALATGTFLATAVGTRLRIRRPVALQAAGLVLVAALAALATVRFSLPLVAVLCLLTAAVSGIAKLALDATIQERIAEHLRASAFAHSETVHMLAFVLGGTMGLAPLPGRVGIGLAAALAGAAAVATVASGRRSAGDRLSGRASEGQPVPEPAPGPSPVPPGPGPSPVPPGPGPIPGPPRPGPTPGPPPRPVPAAGSSRPAPAAGSPRPDPAPGPSTAQPGTGPAQSPPEAAPPTPGRAATPGFHIYRPSSLRSDGPSHSPEGRPG